MRFWQDVNTALLVGVFVASSCVEHRSLKPYTPQRPSAAPAPPPAEPLPDRAPSQTGYATFYARRFAGRRTANGERYDPMLLTAAHRTLPFGTMVEVRRANGAGSRVVVRVNDRGPFARGRIIDLSFAAARRLDMVRSGTARVRIEAIEGESLSTAR